MKALNRHQTNAILTLWRYGGLDTLDIAGRLHIRESQVYNYLAWARK